MKRVRFKLLFLVLIISLFYTIYPTPFISNSQFWTYTPFSIASTISNIVSFTTTVTSNILLVVVLLKKQRTPIFGSINFLVVLMCLADIIYTTFRLPLVISYTWIRTLSNRSDSNIDYNLYMGFLGFSTSMFYGGSGISMAAFTLACSQRLYLVTSQAVDYVGRKAKYLLLILCILYGGSLFSINVVWTDTSIQTHLWNSILLVFFPITVNLIVLATIVFYKTIRGRFYNDRNLNFVGLYVMYCSFFVCWVPFVTISAVHLYLVNLEDFSQLMYILPTLFSVKSALNLPLLVATDERLYEKCVDHVKTLFYKTTSRRSRRHEENNNVLRMYTELQDFHLSASRINMYNGQEQQQPVNQRPEQMVQYYV